VLLHFLGVSTPGTYAMTILPGSKCKEPASFRSGLSFIVVTRWKDIKSYSFTTKCTLRFFCMQASLCWRQSGRSLP
jgi:hypothetical protein